MSRSKPLREDVTAATCGLMCVSPCSNRARSGTARANLRHSGKATKRMMRTVLVTGLAFVLAACGDATDFQQIRQGALDLGGQALEAATGLVDTRTACVLAGQPEAFCECVQDNFGAELSGEQLEMLRNAVNETLNGQGLQAVLETSGGPDAETRNAIVQCAANAAVEGALGEAGN